MEYFPPHWDGLKIDLSSRRVDAWKDQENIGLRFAAHARALACIRAYLPGDCSICLRSEMFTHLGWDADNTSSDPWEESRSTACVACLDLGRGFNGYGTQDRRTGRTREGFPSARRDGIRNDPAGSARYARHRAHARTCTHAHARSTRTRAHGNEPHARTRTHARMQRRN
jgi:hypothetical protein